MLEKSQASGDQSMQSHYTDHDVFIINYGQELHRWWWRLHLLHCFHRHGFWSDGPWLPAVTDESCSAFSIEKSRTASPTNVLVDDQDHTVKKPILNYLLKSAVIIRKAEEVRADFNASTWFCHISMSVFVPIPRKFNLCWTVPENKKI